MTDETPEYSKGGSRIYRHQALDEPFERASQDAEAIEKLEAHIQRHIPGEGFVFHELISDKVHIDVHIKFPTTQRKYYTLITTGMSDRPMHAPEGAQSYRYSELMMCLPPTWRLQQEDFSDEANYWPIRWLKILAGFPHDYKTWLWVTHTVPNGDPAQAFAHNTKLCGVLIASPVLFGDDFLAVKASDEKTVYINSVIPIYQDEMEYKLESGADALFDLFGQNGVTELLNPGRKSVIKKRGLLGFLH